MGERGAWRVLAAGAMLAAGTAAWMVGGNVIQARRQEEAVRREERRRRELRDEVARAEQEEEGLLSEYRGLMVSILASEAHTRALEALVEDSGGGSARGEGGGAEEEEGHRTGGADEDERPANTHPPLEVELPGGEELLPRSLQMQERDASVEDLHGWLEVLARRVVSRVQGHFNAETVVWMTVESSSDTLCINFPSHAAGWRVPSQLGLAGMVARQGAPKLMRDATKSSLFHSALDGAVGVSKQSSVCAPILGPDGKVIAVVQSVNKQSISREGSFTSLRGSSTSMESLKGTRSPSIIIKSPASRLVDRMFDPPSTPPRASPRPIAGRRSSAQPAFQPMGADDHLAAYDADDLFWIAGIAKDASDAIRRMVVYHTRPYTEVSASMALQSLLDGMCRAVQQHPYTMPPPLALTPTTDFLDSKRKHSAAYGPPLGSPLTSYEERKGSNEMSPIAVCAQHSYGIRTLHSPISVDRHSPKVSIDETGTGKQSSGEDGVAEKGDGDEEQHSGSMSGSLSNRMCPCEFACVLEGFKFKGRLAAQLFWGFDPGSCSTDTLRRYAVDMFVSLGYVEMFGMDLCRIANYVRNISLLYSEQCSYHNFAHGFHSMLAAYLLIKDADLASFLEPTECLALLIASLCMNVGHSGFTNEFLVATSHSTAKTYNDQMCQENLHCSLAFQVMSQPSCNLLHSLSKDDFKKVRKVIIAGILSLDMKGHASHLTRLRVSCEIKQLEEEKQSEDGGSEDGVPEGDTDNSLPFNKSSEEDRQFVVNTMIKAAYLAKQTLRLSVAKEWMKLRVKELERQLMMEKEMGLPLTALPGVDAAARSEFQLSIMEYQIVPFWASVATLWPVLSHAYEQLERNLVYYQDAHVIMLKGGNTEATCALPKMRREILGRMVMTSSIVARAGEFHGVQLSSSYTSNAGSETDENPRSFRDSDDDSGFFAGGRFPHTQMDSTGKLSRAYSNAQVPQFAERVPKVSVDVAPSEDQLAAASAAAGRTPSNASSIRRQQRRSSLPSVLVGGSLVLENMLDLPSSFHPTSSQDGIQE